MGRQYTTVDGNEAVAYVAYKTNEVIAIYPITPSTSMGELSDAWAAAGEKNLFGGVPIVQEMQSEGGAAGAIHGALQTGSLTTTFTASQGLLLMIPNMYKIAGELTPTVFHVTARSLATHALSIFGDHSDVMSVRQTGWGMLFSASVQEAQDFALIAQSATLRSRIPFVHAFDGFRTSSEVAKIEKVSEETIRGMIDEKMIRAHRDRALSPDHPVIRGTAQNPDVFFQAREAANPFYAAAPEIVREAMQRFEALTGRHYDLFEYIGAPDAERVVILMASGCETAVETVEQLIADGEKVGVLKVRLYRPFSVSHFVQALPATVKAIAVLDRTKEPGSAGEPLYQDVVTAINEAISNEEAPFTLHPRIIGGRYGLSSKEFTPAMVKAVFDSLKVPKSLNHFTVGIVDDVSHTSLDVDPFYNLEQSDVVRGIFYGLGADGTVGANKNTIKIIGEQTPFFAQGYFVYDSKKSGSMTTSHLRFGPRALHCPYLIQKASFVAVHQFGFLEKIPVLDTAEPGATVLLNSPFGPDEIWAHLPSSFRRQAVEKKLNVYAIDAYTVARESGMGMRINTIMQTAFFALSGVLPQEEAIACIKKAIQKTYSKRGQSVVDKNWAAVDAALSHLYQVMTPDTLEASDRETEKAPVVPEDAPDFVKKVTAEIIAGRGDLLPVSAMPVDGTFPTATTRWEKRNIATEIPAWVPDLCIECGKCVLVCPHAAIRAKIYPARHLDDAPEQFKSADAKFKEFPGRYTIQVAVDDCTGCGLCVDVCPAKDKADPTHKALNMHHKDDSHEAERKNWGFFLKLPEVPRDGTLPFSSIKNIQLLQPLFEFSGACAGCGQTPYLKLVSQLYGDRALIANATGCSSIYGGNLPTTPWAKNAQGRGPAWANSLFEDNAEFGMGMRLTVDQQSALAKTLVESFRTILGNELADGLLHADQHDDAGIGAQRERVEALRKALAGVDDIHARDLISIADSLVEKSVWIVGGDGWAYDIGYGGLDHVLASGPNVNVLVLDTEVYSNTGGQASKSTGIGAVAKFAAGGKRRPKKDLGRMAMAYGNVYVAQIALGGKDQQVVRAIREAESYPGPSLIIAYGSCIAHGIDDMVHGLDHQRLAVESGYWPLYRYDPRLADEGKNPFQLDSKAPTVPLEDYFYSEDRYRVLKDKSPETALALLEEARTFVQTRWREYEQLAAAK